jgi:hypothetical protein
LPTNAEAVHAMVSNFQVTKDVINAAHICAANIRKVEQGGRADNIINSL